MTSSASSNMIHAFNIENHICHNDTTCAFVYGNCDNNQSDQSIKKRGRPAAAQPVEKIKIVKDHFRLQLHFNEKAVEDARYRSGYYPLVTNKPVEDLSIQWVNLNFRFNGYLAITRKIQRAIIDGIFICNMDLRQGK